MKTFVALLRGINVGGKHKLPMAGLRSACEGIGCSDVRTYIQSGNVVLATKHTAAETEHRLEQAIERQFGFSVPVIVRSAASWTAYADDNPFPAESAAEGNRVLLALSKRVPHRNAASALQQHATRGEKIAAAGDAIWIHYGNGVGTSRLTPAVLDRCVGSPVTARNWRTVAKIVDMLQAAAGE